ncbi:MAG TPA: GHMP kinase [Acidimicrobiia bacterium]|nr:GHMP kinase [Acidimicrobiia bacterium]
MELEVSAPVRICDLGGWTDTWFGGPGRVLNVAVTPGVTVSVRELAGPPRLVIDVESPSPLVHAAVEVSPPPSDRGLEIRVRAAVPPGCGAGTSAAVAVALLTALAESRGEPWSARSIARDAHRLEVEHLGLESGVQDQLSAALGGVNFIEIDAYPAGVVHRLPDWDDLGARLSLVSVGRAHDSSSVHRDVIGRVAAQPSTAFDRLRAAAMAARDAVLARDLRAFGAAMIDNTEAQRALHADLVGVDAQRVVDLAADCGALGWKVNGAGGDGGSLTLLSANADAKRTLDAAVARLDARYRVFPIAISPTGLTIRRL